MEVFALYYGAVLIDLYIDAAPANDRAERLNATLDPKQDRGNRFYVKPLIAHTG